MKKRNIVFSLVVLSVFSVSVALGIATAGYVTEEGWIKNPANGHYYKLTAPMNWLDAEAQAIEWDGHLVTLNSWEEESWIKTVFGENEYFWIGFNDIAEEGNWVWSSGEPVTYTNWDEGEPNDCGGWGPDCEPEDAAVMNWAVCIDPEPGKCCYGDKWNDLSIGASLQGIVESGVQANVTIKPETLDLNSKGLFTAFITLPESYNIADIDISTVVCEGAPAVKGMVADDNKYIAKFDREDLREDLPTGEEVKMRVTGKLYDETSFEGLDRIRVIAQGKGN